MYIARIADGREESVCNHSRDTASLAEQNAPEFLKATAKLTALLHDAGKNCDEFYEYLKKAVMDPGSVRVGSVTHSTAGAMIADALTSAGKTDHLTAEIIRHAIISHHGVYDCVNLEGTSAFALRCQKQQGLDKIGAEVQQYLPIEEQQVLFSQGASELNAVVHRIAELTSGTRTGSKAFYFGMLERLLLSLLIDADRTSSAYFSKAVTPKPVTAPEQSFWDGLIEALEAYLAKKASDTHLARIRSEISSACKVASTKSERMLRLVVPTGAGKTLSSLRYALHHARSFHKKHIFYIAPFNSILDQNAKVFREALGTSNPGIILEHHSNLISDDSEDYKELTENETHRELTENWSAPIVLTSAVQLLNSLFSAHSGSIRRMHALQDSVIIVDEVQSIPMRCIVLFNLAMNFLTKICGASVVLCSATQPPYQELSENRLLPPVDMLSNHELDLSVFKRTRILDETLLLPGGMDAADVARFTDDQLGEASSVLVIVNTKKCAKAVYDALKDRLSRRLDAPELFHLSTNMCPVHRRNTIKQLESRLKGMKPVVCVSTQLIEAGVDISFQTVIRSMAGLQNVIQSAGRCNRNAEKPCGDVHIVRLSDSLEDLSRLPEIREAQDALYSVLDANRTQGWELDSAEAMDEYYRRYFYDKNKVMSYRVPQFDTSIVDLLSSNSIGANNLWRKERQTLRLAQAFKTAGEHFYVIEEKDATDVLVEYDARSRELIGQLNAKMDIKMLKALLTQLQPYTVSLSKTMLRSLGDAVYTVANGSIQVLQKAYYSQETGVTDTPSQMDLLMC